MEKDIRHNKIRLRLELLIIILISALLNAFSFPKFNIFIFSFLFLIPLLYALDKKKTSNAFLLFFFSAFISYLIIIYWIPRVMIKYGGTGSFFGLLGLITLSAFLSIFPGLAGVFIKKAIQQGHLFLFLTPFIWISKDLVLEKIFGGFPWGLCGYSQYKNILFIQFSEIGGIHLISFLILFINVLLYLTFRDRNRSFLIALGVTLVFIYSTGYFLLKTNQDQNQNLKIHQGGIIQPNTSHDINFDQDLLREKFEELMSQSKKLSENGAEFIIWPEFTIPIYPMQNNYYRNRFSDFVQTNCPIFAGFTDLKNDQEIYNAVMLFKKDDIEQYNKVHLAPFGEYVPFKKILFFVEQITDEIGEFTPGEKIHNLVINNHPVATPICYELIYPGLVRDFIIRGGELIIILSNDSWYGKTATPYQLLSMAVFRSIENRRFILRSTTNGISALISPGGRIEQQLKLHTRGELLASFKYLTQKTIFTRFGYLFPYLCIIISILFFLIRSIKKQLTPLYSKRNLKRIKGKS